MGLAVVPDDWTDGYADWCVKWPDSPQWKAILKGLLTSPIYTTFWDKYTGDPASSILAIEDVLGEIISLEECSMIPVGTIWTFAGADAPTGWLIVNRDELSRSEYAALFAVVGETFGNGNGTTTFSLELLVGRSHITTDLDDTDFEAPGQVGGVKSYTLEIEEMPIHTHLQNPHTHIQNPHTHADNRGATSGASWTLDSTVNYALGNLATDYPALVAVNATATNQNATATNQDAGGGEQHYNLPPYVVINKIIKY